MPVLMYITYIGSGLQMNTNNICENERARNDLTHFKQLVFDSVKLIKRHQMAFCFYDYQIEMIEKLLSKSNIEIEIIKTECGYMLTRKRKGD